MSSRCRESGKKQGQRIVSSCENSGLQSHPSSYRSSAIGETTDKGMWRGIRNLFHGLVSHALNCYSKYLQSGDWCERLSFREDNLKGGAGFAETILS